VTVYTRGVTVYTYTRGVNLLDSNYILLYTMSSANTSNSKNGSNKKHGSKNEVSQPKQKVKCRGLKYNSRRNKYYWRSIRDPWS